MGGRSGAIRAMGRGGESRGRGELGRGRRVMLRKGKGMNVIKEKEAEGGRREAGEIQGSRKAGKGFGMMVDEQIHGRRKKGGWKIMRRGGVRWSEVWGGKPVGGGKEGDGLVEEEGVVVRWPQQWRLWDGGITKVGWR